MFFTDTKGNGVFQHAADYSLVTASNPAHAGEYLIAYGINLGPVRNTPSSGAPAPSDPLPASIPPGTPQSGVCGMADVIQIGATKVVPSYVGLAPGTAGVYQVNFQLPGSLTQSGDVPVTLARTITANSFGQCLGSGLGNTSSTSTSRQVLLPVR